MTKAEPLPAPSPALPPGPEPEASPAPEPFLPAEPISPAPRKAPELTRVRLLISGADHFTEEQIRAAIADQLTAIQTSGLSPALADDTAFFLGVFYRKNGFSQAEVKSKIEGRSTLRLMVQEGPLTTLASVGFRGNRQIPDSTLLSYLLGGTKERISRKNQPVPFVESDVMSGIERISGLYHSEGYLDAVVDPPEISLSANKTAATVIVTVHEGIQYRFGTLTFKGDLIFFPQQDLLKELEVFTSKPYTPQAVTNLERKVAYYYRSKGYFMAKVRVESDPAQAKNGMVPVLFLIEAGDIYRFDGVTQSGLKKLKPDLLERRFRNLRGKVYSPAVVEERYRSLMATGLFTNLKLTQNPLPNHEVELQFEVEEAKSRELGFSVGYGSLEGPIIGARYTDRNLFGYGNPLSINAEVAQKLLRGEVAYSVPWIFGSEYTLRERLYALGQDLDDYNKTETGLRSELSRKFGQHLEFTAFTLNRLVQLSSVAVDPDQTGKTNYRADSLGASVTLDYRDSRLNPRKGFVVNVTTDLALAVLGSSLDFSRTTLRATYYQPIGKTLLALGVRGGVLYTLTEQSELPIDERFFNGGARTVRSYVERTLGPHDTTGHPIGGETFTNANIEDVFPLFGNLDGAVFFDFGSVGRQIDSGLGTTGCAIGAGLRYKLPVGPIRLDYGWNPIQGHNQPQGAWHLSFGFAF